MHCALGIVGTAPENGALGMSPGGRTGEKIKAVAHRIFLHVCVCVCVCCSFKRHIACGMRMFVVWDGRKRFVCKKVGL